MRERNEDRAVGTDRLLAVADGMGGPPGGDIAASTAVAVLEAAFAGRSLDELAAGVRASNAAVFARARGDRRLEGMGTTLCAVGVTDSGELAVVNVGDSRAYRLRDGSFEQLTTDHSLTAELIRQGRLRADEAVDHPERAILTRALGVGPSVDVDEEVHVVTAGDRLLLCSDGLWSEVTDDELRTSIESDSDLGSVARAVVDHALAAGGSDNITVVVADVLASTGVSCVRRSCQGLDRVERRPGVGGQGGAPAAKRGRTTLTSSRTGACS